MPSLQAHPRLLLLPLLALAACSSTGYHGSPVPSMVANGQFEAAVVVAARQYEANPDNPVAEEEYRGASVAMLLERARRATFEDRDDEALFHLDQAQEIDPENEMVRIWQLKTRRKLSSTWLDRAQELSGRSDIAGAMEAFERAMAYDPQSSAAKQGIGRMLLLMNYREGRGKAYYKEGVRSLRAFWLHDARAKFNYAGQKYIPADEASRERSAAVQKLLAEERVAQALQLEESGLYFAAGNEYRLSLLLDPENEQAADGKKRMEREGGAVKELEHAEWLRMRGRFEDARKALAEGLDLTESQGERFEVGAIDIQEEEYRLLYEEALRLEMDFQYPEAVEAYERLLEVAGYYQDAITRRAVLVESIAKAEDLYARAMETSDEEERVGYLSEIQLVWPEFKDVPRLLKELGAE